MPSNAAKEWSGTISELEQKHAKLERRIACHLAEHKAQDQLGHNDQCAPHQQAIDTLSRHADKVEVFLSDAIPRMGKAQ